MSENEIGKYQSLNTLAGQGGIVLFGGREDLEIPLGELKQAFGIEYQLYNRSIPELSLADAIAAYDACVAPLAPETVLLHMGEADRQLFRENPREFDRRYGELIAHIRMRSPKCEITVISLKNYENDRETEELNRHLKYIADSERCEYGDIAEKKVWNPKSTMEALSFVCSLGGIRPRGCKQPLYDLVKILFCSVPMAGR